MTGWEIYWILKLDTFLKVSQMFSVLFGIIFFFAIIASIASKIDGDETSKLFRRVAISFGLLFLLFLPLGIFLPSTKQMAAIIIAPPIINNEKVQQIPNKLLDILGLTTELLEKKLKDKGKK